MFKFIKKVTNLITNNYYIALVSLFVISLPFFKNVDSDFFWHIRTGQYILNTKTIPTTDIFSSTSFSHIWILHEWGSEVIMYFLYNKWGYFADCLLFGLIFSLTWIIVYICCLKLNKNKLISIALIVLGILISVYAVGARPQLISQLFIAITLLILLASKDNSKKLYLFPLLFIFWVNLHGGWVIGIGLVGMYILMDSLYSIKDKAKIPFNKIIIFISSILGIIIFNPNHIQGFLYPFTYYLGGNDSLKYINEWQSVNFHTSTGIFFLLFILYMLFVGVRKNSFSIKEYLVLGTFFIFGITSERNLPILTIIAIPLISIHTESFELKVPQVLKTWLYIEQFMVLLIILCVIFITNSSIYQGKLITDPWQNANDIYPSGNANYILSHNLKGNIYNSYGDGGFLIYKLYPYNKVFIDGRADVYTDKIFKDYFAIMDANSNWQSILSKYNIKIVIADNSIPIYTLLNSNPNWKLVNKDKVSGLFLHI